MDEPWLSRFTEWHPIILEKGTSTGDETVEKTIRQ